ncbi:MAG TPA: M4 family metallopeptidase [Candidatus Eisenbacteria bacterium]
MCQTRGSARSPVLCIVPPHMLKHLARTESPELSGWALHTLSLSERLRGTRTVLGPIAPLAVTPAGAKRRAVYDARHTETLPGRLVRSEGDPPKSDPAVNEAYDGAGFTYDLYFNVYGRNSIDDRGMRIDSSVHYGVKFDNAFWDGRQMVYGDGDGTVFRRFTVALDVIGHELTHGVTDFEAALDYQDQSGALNESCSDVFGSLVKQYHLGQTAADADWLIGAGLFARGVQGVALRSMKAPGTAYDDPRLGKDPQPASMKDYVQTHEDSGGVHINSGIPNRAFYLAATAIGGRAWERAGKIWYVALRDRLRHDSDFAAAARLTAEVAAALYGADGPEAAAVRDAWNEVGVSAAPAARRTGANRVRAQRRAGGHERPPRPRGRRPRRRRA